MSEQELRQIASAQRGFFRTDQALEFGLSRRYLSAARVRGDITSVRYGLYRFADHPPTPLDRLYEIGTATPTGTISHETALEFHALSDVVASAVHVTVPAASGLKSRRGLVVHHSDLRDSDRQLRNGLWLTRVARTIRDCARTGTDPAQLAAAFREGIERGLMTPDEARELYRRYPFLTLPAGMSRRSEPAESLAGPARITGSGDESLPDWERLLAAAARLQKILPDATLVGGTAAAIVAGHRRSLDADHTIAEMSDHFDDVLADVEAAAGWKTARRKRPVIIMGSLDGILTTVRNLRRVEPLETFQFETPAGPIRLPVPAEILRIKGWLAVSRNVTRDFLDVAAISDHLGLERAAAALSPLDRLYPQGESGAVRQQLMRQLAMPRPADLADIAPRLAAYKGIDPRWGRWEAVGRQCAELSMAMADALVAGTDEWSDLGAGKPMSHRHLTGGTYDLPALDDLLENGGLPDWRPVLSRLARDPNTPLSENIERLVARRDYEETGAFWRLFIDHARAR
ncbi:MAG: type IV toxin-antitoxin system AbiEi family antitoxin domain-containing protein [Candidatus Limnocylindrales bacterium]